MPDEDKKYEDLKNPPDFPDSDSDNTSSDASSNDVSSDDSSSDKPDIGEQLNQVSETLSKIDERMNTLEEKITTTTPSTGEGDTGDFKPDFESGKFLPDDYKPQTYNEFLKKTVDIVEQIREHKERKMSQQEKEWNEEWTKQLDSIATKDPKYKVIDPNDKNDEGRKARAQLLIEAAQAGATDLVGFYNATAPYRKGVSRKKTPPSAGAPVGSGKRGGSSSPTARSYEELKKPIDQVMAEKYPDLATP